MFSSNDRYAYIEIALYGKPYLAAAKDTWRLFKNRGIDALINDSLVGMSTFSLCSGKFVDIDCVSNDLGRIYRWPFILVTWISIPALYAYHFTFSQNNSHIRAVTHPAYNADGQYTPAIILFSFLIGLTSCK